jgi:hypothetical protein
MAKANITEYDSTAGNNTVINDIDISEGCSPSTINNAIRELMAHLKNVDTGSQALTALSVTGALSAKGGAVFNEDSADVDFRVESNDDANMFFVDAGNNRIGVRKSAPDTAFHMGGGSDNHQMVLQGNTVQRLGLQLGTDSRVFLGAATGNHFRVSKQDASALFDVNPSGNIILGQSGAGIHLGVTSATASNLLDDYEEGTWTPSFVNAPSGTVSSLSGQYTKIGRTVYLQFQVSGSSLAISSYARIQGLPFSASDDSDTGTYVLGSIASRGHGWTTVASGQTQLYLSESGTTSSPSGINGSLVYRAS